MTVEESFSLADLSLQGQLPWDTPVNEDRPGIYVVALSAPTTFIPSEPAERDLWVIGESILYIGQTTKQSIKRRLSQFYKHNYGARSPHRGGQAIKLLANEPDVELVVYWVATLDALRKEREMLLTFKDRVGKWPYANRKYPRPTLMERQSCSTPS